MRGISLKTIFIVLIILLIGWAIYHNLFHTDQTNHLVGQTTKQTAKETIQSNDLRIGIIEFDNMNPILSNNKNVQDISRLIFDPLFTLTQDYRLQESLATEWSKLDEKTYLIKLRENVKWQDGNDFNASDVVFTIDMLKKKDNHSVYYYNVQNITSVEEIDEYTLKIKINEAIPYFEYNFIFPIVSSKYFDQDSFLLESKNIRPVGTGQFYISDIENNHILLKKNGNGWNQQEMRLETITLCLYDSLSNAMNGFKSGEIDLFTTSNLEIEDYLKNISHHQQVYVNRNYDYIALNCHHRILSNVEVRQAIHSAINKDEIIKDIYHNQYQRSNFPLDFGSYVYNTNNTIIAYDKNTAKRLLVDAGWKYSSNKWRKIIDHQYTSIELKLVVNKNQKNLVKVANKIKEHLESVGIRINIVEATEKQYNAYVKNKNYDMLIASSTYSYSPSLNKYFKKDNLANYQNDELTERLKESENTTNENEIKQIYTRITEIYNNDVPYISLYFNTNTLICSDSLKGTISPNSYNLFYGIENWYREYKK